MSSPKSMGQLSAMISHGKCTCVDETNLSLGVELAAVDRLVLVVYRHALKARFQRPSRHLAM